MRKTAIKTEKREQKSKLKRKSEKTRERDRSILTVDGQSVGIY